MEKLKQVLHSPLSRRRNGMTKKVFGISLENLMKLQTTQLSTTEDSPYTCSSNVPFVVDRICRHIFANGIEEEGIFRVNGNTRVMEKLRESFEKHGDADLESTEDIYAVAALLKQFLRDLPEAVIPEQLSSQFVKYQEASTTDKEQFPERLVQLLDQLPKPNYDLLKYISRFLVDVAAKDSNRMSPMGLAIVFGPNLFRCSAGIEGLRDQGVINELVCKFIIDYQSLFGELTEPGPFTIPYIHQVSRANKEKKKQPPLRPPPPKLTVSNPSVSVPLEMSEDLRPTTSFSQEFMERASPFTIADGDGHSSIASPVLSAVASELVTKTISEAVLEHIFSEKEVLSIFDNWGESDDINSRNSTPHSLGYHKHQPSHDSLHPATANTLNPQPRPRTMPDHHEENTGPQPKPRMQKKSQSNHAVIVNDERTSTEPPTPKPRTKSAPARSRPLGEVFHESIDIPLVSNKAGESGDSQSKRKEVIASKNVDAVDEFDTIAASVTKLHHFKKPSGPSKRASRRRISHDNLDSVSSHPVEIFSSNLLAEQKKQDGNDINNNANNSVHLSRNADQAPDVGTVAAAPLIVVDDSADLDTSGTAAAHKGLPNSTEALEVATSDHLLSSSPHGNAVDGLTPEPKSQHHSCVEDEHRATQIKTLNKRITGLKKKIKSFEDAFEAEHGHKPSTQEKNSKVDIKKLLVELSKCRKDLKSLGAQEDSDVKEQGPSSARVDSVEPSMPNGEQDSSRSESVIRIGTSSEPPTMADTLDLLLKKLKDKRQEANRADAISTLTRDQVQEEKLAVQKALLHFESIHGRPQTKSEKELMRPLYDRYRQIKKALATAPVSKSEKKVEEPLLGEADPTETNNGEMLVTQFPEAKQTTGVAEEDDRGDTPADDKTDRDANLQDLSVPELKAELEKANNVKKKLRKLLREFEDEFQKEKSRKVQKEDRGPMDSKYQEYKQIKARIKLLEGLLSKHEGS
ncbi:protein FAM13A-like isoform X2 [Watersipora subatra]|uniref:protein FAM13A-like isoform X2 n=1 Tax=Watersipora subatra TaxID=2589382 RepID=UPI00355B33A9